MAASFYVINAVKHKTEGCLDMITADNMFDVVGPRGESLLHYAVDAENFVVADHLLALGMHINLGDQRGGSALTYACYNKMMKGVEYLASKNANPCVLTGTDTPLSLMPAALTPLYERVILGSGTNLYRAYAYRLYMLTMPRLNCAFARARPLHEEVVTLNAKANELWFMVLCTDSVKQCLYCRGDAELKLCGGCRRVYFCGTECQRAAHVLHKLDCKK